VSANPDLQELLRDVFAGEAGRQIEEGFRDVQIAYASAMAVGQIVEQLIKLLAGAVGAPIKDEEAATQSVQRYLSGSLAAGAAALAKVAGEEVVGHDLSSS
jgi:hypothetical protein